MKLNKTKLLSNGYIIFSTLFFVFCFIFIESLNSSSRLSDIGLAIMPPENLNSSLEMFSLHMQKESQDFPADDMIKTESWAELKATVSEYAQQLALFENQLRLIKKQNRQRLSAITYLYLFSAIGMATCAMLKPKVNKKKTKKKKASR